MLKSNSCLKFSAGLLALSALVWASPAQSQTVNIPMNGNVPGSCTFGAVSGGTLAKVSGPAPIMMASGGGISGGIFSAGTAGRVTVTCQNSSALTISPPTGSGPIGFAPSVVQAVVQKGTSLSSTDLAGANIGGTFEPVGPWATTNPTLPLQSGPTVLNVSMVAGVTPSSPPAPPLPTGNYTYNITLTITGN